MKIVIHGTKGGYDTLTPEKIYMIDARPDYNKVAAIGAEAYAINFNKENVIFSKYKIIRDVIGDKRTGNIAFSILMPFNEKLAGKLVKELLDELKNKFCSKHMPNNSNNLDGFKENWDFVEELKEKYRKEIIHEEEQINQQGTEDAAFFYYENDAELEKYFDNPNLKEYIGYKQVFFVEKQWEENPANPLFALRHNPRAEIKEIDLENTQSVLKNFDGTGKDGIIIKIYANDIQLYENGVIYKKDNIRIEYSINKYYNSQKIKITEKNYNEFFKVDGKKVTVKNDLVLKKVEKSIGVQAIFNNTNLKTSDIKIKSINTDEKKDIINNKFEFVGEEFKDTWIISVSKPNIWEPLEFIPEHYENKTLEIKFKNKVEKNQSNNSQNNSNSVTDNSKERWHAMPIWAWVTIFVFIAASFIFLLKFNSKNSVASSEVPYAEGNEIFINKLEDLKKICYKNLIESEGNKESMWTWSKFFSSDKNDPVKSPSNKNEDCSKIDSALAIRRAINNGEIEKLKNFTYSPKQQKFKDIIGEIKKEYIDTIGKILLNAKVSEMNLVEIADLISKRQIDLESKKTPVVSSSKTEGKSNVDIGKPIENKTYSNNGNDSNDTATKTKTKDNKPKGSLLEKDFWKLVNDGNVKKESYDYLRKEYINEKSDITKYLKIICASTDSFKKFSEIAAITRKKASKLTQLNYESN